jgi:hypothetical protein
MKYKQTSIKLKTGIASKQYKILLALNEDTLSKEAVIWQLLTAWYLPFQIKQDDSQLQAVALEALGLLEGRANAIREYAGLGRKERVSFSTESDSGISVSSDEPILEELDEAEAEPTERFSEFQSEIGQLGLS